MGNIVKSWRELKGKILNSETMGKKYVLNFWEKDGIVKPYSKLIMGDTSCNIQLDRTVMDLETGKIIKRIHIDMRDLVYGI
ncbi:hypothetical protein [uncultured Clostridium sp.]|uniref:hypothetical protein n=1 Tax=uncultured Clostridium sp. TaxID=59620 RepID=UPI00272DCC51|nr:hypothetical protein [uncultured Clostridium sp.]